jgi:hypothetical protein
VAGVILAVTLIFLLWRTWRGARWLESAGWATFAVLVTTSWLLPWYIVWLVPLAALARGYALRVAAVAFSVFVIITHLSVISDVPTAADIRPLLHPRACTGAHQVGCPGVGRRTVPALLQHALARGFKRAYQAERRVLIGRLGRPPVRRAVRVQCRSRSKAFWTCHVRYVLRGRRDFRYATYSVVVDPRGCFVATSRNFPARLPELVLHRSASNPLARIGSCP